MSRFLTAFSRAKRLHKGEWLFIVGLLLLASGLRFRGIDFGQPDMRYAPTAAARNLLPLETPIHPDEYFYAAIPYEMSVTKYPNPKFYENSTFLIYLNFVTYLVTDSAGAVDRADWEGHGQREFAPFPAYVIGRVYSALGGVLAVAATYAAARRIGGRFAAAGAGLLTAVSFTLVQHAHYTTASSLSAGFAAVAVWACVATLQQRQPKGWLFALAGIAAGLAFTTRYNTGGVSIVVFLTGLVLLYRFRTSEMLRVVAVGWLLVPIVFVLGTPGIIFDPEKFWRDFTRIFTQFVTTGYGFSQHYLTDAWLSLWFHLRYLVLFSLGVPAALAAAIGVYAAWRQRPRSRSLARNSALLFVGMLLIYLLVYALVVLRNVRPSYNDHMLVPVIPQFALLAGLGAAWLYQRLPLPKPLLAPALLIGMVIVTLVPAVQVDSLFAQPDTRYRMQAWVYEHLPRGSRVHLSAPYNVPLDPADFETTHTFIDDFTSVDELRARGVEYVILSDAWLHDVRRSQEFMSPEFVRQVTDYYASYDRDALEIARVERPAWTGHDWLMHTASYWHHPALTVYCLTAESCAAVD